jgi:2-polyprenyl-3-methyl-5-hydroxy-6-metoxy-1,4-benzoquinol methylase
MTPDGILQDQIDYYRARAGEYDEWWFRQGRYDRGAEFNARWHAETATVENELDAWLARTRPRSVLELACGTGLFTRRIAPRVARLTAIDASPEVIAINRARTGSANVTYLQADLFEWQPRWQPHERHDAVFFGFWLSHVPDRHFARFWENVAAALAPDGAAFLVDSAFDPTSTARNHHLPRRDAGVVTRKLNDGREFRIVKVFWEPQTLAASLEQLRWSATLAQTPSYFIHGEVRPPKGTAIG